MKTWVHSLEGSLLLYWQEGALPYSGLPVYEMIQIYRGFNTLRALAQCDCPTVKPCQP
jgi:hypothetical protein